MLPRDVWDDIQVAQRSIQAEIECVMQENAGVTIAAGSGVLRSTICDVVLRYVSWKLYLFLLGLGQRQTSKDFLVELHSSILHS